MMTMTVTNPMDSRLLDTIHANGLPACDSQVAVPCQKPARRNCKHKLTTVGRDSKRQMVAILKIFLLPFLLGNKIHRFQSA